MNYARNLNFYKDYDLCRIGELYSVNPDDIPKERMTEQIDELFEEGFDCPTTSLLRYEDIEDNDLYAYAEYWDFEAKDQSYALNDLLRPANHYLVMAHNCRWTGASGYKIFDSIDDVLSRGYEVSIYPKAVSRGGKCLVCIEHSHDVPTGARTSIIALTEGEYEKLDAWDASWDEVMAFAEKCEEKALKGGVS